MKTFSIFDAKSGDNDHVGVFGGLEEFLSTEEFQERLRIEKYRVDRTGVPLSLALFFLKDELTRGAKKRHEFFVCIKKRTRETDIRGWMNSKVFGLLLFNTDSRGAERCVELLTRDWGHNYFDTLTRTYPDPLFHEILEQPPMKSSGFLSINSPRESGWPFLKETFPKVVKYGSPVGV